MSRNRMGIAKVIVFVVLAILVGVSFTLMTQEEKARSASETVHQTLRDAIEAGESPTPEEVHEMVDRTPHEVRNPGKHRLVEEFHWQGPFSEHRVYAYYTTGATKLLEAVSLNQLMEDWEGDDK